MHHRLVVWTIAILLGTGGAFYLSTSPVRRSQVALPRIAPPPLANTMGQGEEAAANAIAAESIIAKTNSSRWEIKNDQSFGGNDFRASTDPVRVQREVHGLRADYRRFLEQTKRSPDQQQALLELGAQRALLVLDRENGLKTARFQTADQANEYYRTENQRLDGEMRALLGAEYPEFWKATEQLAFKRQMDVYAQLTARHDIPLDQIQCDMLVDLYWKYYKENGVDMFFTPFYSRVSSVENFTDQMKKRARSDALVRADAAAFLTPSQLDRLTNFQEQQIYGMFRLSKLPQKPQ